MAPDAAQFVKKTELDAQYGMFVKNLGHWLLTPAAGVMMLFESPNTNILSGPEGKKFAPDKTIAAPSEFVTKRFGTVAEWQRLMPSAVKIIILRARIFIEVNRG